MSTKKPARRPGLRRKFAILSCKPHKQIADPTSDNHMHRTVFNQIVRDAEIAYAISPIVRKHHLTAEETEKFLVELRIPRAANVAGITDRLVVFQKSQLAE